MKSRCRNNHGPLRTRPSKVVCQEKLACRGPVSVSVIYCEGCRSYQCELCDTILHEDSRFYLHIRGSVISVSEDLLCDGTCALKNFADVNCSLCKAKFCNQCDRQIHSYPSKISHMRTKFETEEFISCEGESNLERSLSTSSEEMMSLSNAEDLPDLLNDSLKFDSDITSFHLLNDKEQLQIKSSEAFAEKLKCDKSKLLKVVSIFGNTGDGKSHTLNHAFYDEKPVFKTSPAQISCTAGAWAAYCPSLDILTIDTEGFLGQTNNENHRARLLLKVLAISDVVIYRTRAERLHNDMFKFLGDASEAYTRHFSKELEDACARCNIDGPLSLLGPAAVIFHETCNTDVLSEGAESILRVRFKELNLKLDAFSHLEYVGVRTNGSPTDFQPLTECVKRLVTNSSIRTARSTDVIFTVLKVLNDKFCIGLDSSIPNTFPDEYFTCPIRCLSCRSRCTSSMNHLKDDIPHKANRNCIYQHQFDNQIFLCRECFNNGIRNVAAYQKIETNVSSLWDCVQYAWSGYKLTCIKHGDVYSSREFWYGNKEPSEICVQEICHVWPQESGNSIVNPNTARYVLDGLTAVTQVVSTMGSKPTKMIASWAADQIAPSYWVPNSKVTECKCGLVFGFEEEKHHCRQCGNIFCQDCSAETKQVQGWGDAKVRVCEECAKTSDTKPLQNTPPNEITVRKIGEVVCSTIGTVATVINYPIGVLKDSARPDYWVPDHLLTNCFVCEKPFGPKLAIHHCRACGNGVCHGCSANSKKVPSKGWTHEVRVCKSCEENPESGVE